MFINLTIDTSVTADRRALAALVAALFIEPAQDVPPVPIEQAIQEAHDETLPQPGAPTKGIAITEQGADNIEAAPPAAPTKPPTVAEATAAIQAAQGRGIGIDKVKDLLAKFEVKRVTELGDDKRAEFVTALGALKA